MASWSEFHPDPRKSYYLFLRQGYACLAHQAHERVKQTDAMIMGLQDCPREARAESRLADVMYMLGTPRTVRMSLTHLWESITGVRTAGSSKSQNRLPSRFSQAG
jgi:hypothetical protein